MCGPTVLPNRQHRGGAQRCAFSWWCRFGTTVEARSVVSWPHGNGGSDNLSDATSNCIGDVTNAGDLE